MQRPPINLLDFEALARELLPPALFDDYSTGADDEVRLWEVRPLAGLCGRRSIPEISRGLVRRRE